MPGVLRGKWQLRDGLVNYLFHSPPENATMPLLTVFGGTAQTISNLMGHHRSLSKRRGVLHYETRGQGRQTTLPINDCSLKQHVNDFLAVLDANPHYVAGETVDLAGFSLGGRLALAIAAEVPELVRKVVITGVAADRGARARAIRSAWLASLEAGNLHSFIWQSLSVLHTEEFLRLHESRLPR